ncbi:MAG: CHAD domain-containing protein [Chlorobiaceae bacterium]
MNTTPKKVYFSVNQDVFPEQHPGITLPTGYRLDVLHRLIEVSVFYDTFEWHAFEKNVAVVKKGKSLFLIDLNTGHTISSVKFHQKPSSFFAENLPVGQTNELLFTCSLIRSFIKLCTIEAIIQSYRILDENDKTIGILKSESLRFADENNTKEPFVHLFSLIPLKGYQEEMERIEISLSQQEWLSNPFCFKELFLLIMSAAGCSVLGYSSKTHHLSLDVNEPVYKNAILLLQFTLSIMRLNESGIRKNIDSEFLHDYRVAIRRTRSILKQLKGLFDPLETEHYLNAFRNLGKRTNELRDQDVYLLRQATYFRYLPPNLQIPLKTFFIDIAISRNALHKRFCRYLASSSYHFFLEEWETFLNNPVLPDPAKAPYASLSTLDVASDTIKKAWKKILRHGRKIGSQATNTELHTLRIDCKKLRYLLEFFVSCFPQKSISPVIKQLKELQENLGDFVDFAVQIKFLNEYLFSNNNEIEKRLLAASIGGLMTALYQKQEEARQKFNVTFNTFDNDKTAQLFLDLLTCSH